MAHKEKETTLVTCSACSEEKATTEFYKCRSRKNGLQAKCKICCRIDGIQFRYENPQYYTGSDLSYFNKNSKQWQAYLAQFIKANKTSIVYSLETPYGNYVGCTKTYLWNRMAQHRRNYRFYKKGNVTSNIIPLLYAAWDKMSDEEWIKSIVDVQILEEFPKSMTKSALLKKETEWIQKLSKQGYTLLNTNKILQKV